MKLAWVGADPCALGFIAVVAGVLSVGAVAEIGDRVWPILLFVVSITIVAGLAAKAGLSTTRRSCSPDTQRGRPPRRRFRSLTPAYPRPSETAAGPSYWAG